jgi:probable HAF family extracellular repeat protein
LFSGCTERRRLSERSAARALFCTQTLERLMTFRPFPAAIDNTGQASLASPHQSLPRCAARSLRPLCGLLIVLFAWIAFAVSHDAAAQQATLTDLGQLSGNPALPNGVSGDGKTVTGYTFGGPANEAFSWSNGTITPLGFVTGYTLESRGTAINSDGTVITGWSRSATADQAFRWTAGTMTGIGALPVTSPPCGGGTVPSSQAFALSADGTTVAGQSLDNTECNGDGFRWASGTMQALVCPLSPVSNCFQNNAVGVSSDGSAIVGSATQSGDLSGAAWRWSGGAFHIFAGPFTGESGQSAFVAGVTPDGNTVVGTIAPAFNQPTQPFLWSNSTGTMTLLGNVSSYSGLSSSAAAVNSDGSVVVGAGGNGVASRWTAAHGVQNLKVLLAASGANVQNWGLTQATGVSSDGTVIVGVGTGPCNCTAGWIASLPTGATNMTDTHDYNHDGTSDMLWQDVLGDVTLWVMSGGSIKSSALLGDVARIDWTIIGQRDFDGDGNADILWRASGGDVAMWLMNGTQVTSTVIVGNVPNNWTVDGTGDLDNDGKGDLLWRDANSGNVVAWYMNGNQVVSQATIATVATTWSIAWTVPMAASSGATPPAMSRCGR